METLLVDRADGVVTVTMNRPERKNAASAAMFDELFAVFEEVARNPADRVMVLTGAGGAFCSGADMSLLRQHDEHALNMMRKVGDAALALHRIPKPTIAKVGGVAAGAGCNMALACDLIVASHSARFSQIFARRGLSLDFSGSWVLPRLVGLHRAKELAFFADILSAEDAERFGFVNRVVPDEELDATVGEWASRLASGPPLALSMTKTMLNAAFETSVADAIEQEARNQALNFSTADVAEALNAFADKRDPLFRGR